MTYIPASVVAIMAHPDDIEFTCAGTLARWARAGCRVSYILCTSGDAGIDEPGMTRARAADIRKEESHAAARLAGAAEVVFLDEPDGLLENTLALRKKLVRELRRLRPEVVMSGDPTVVITGDTYINHPDHRAAATAAIDAVFPAIGQPLVFPELAEEGLHPHKVRKVYLTGRSQHEVFISIDETIDVKIEALCAHKSQMRDWDPGDMIREWAAEAARGKEMQYAESFRVITLQDDETWARLNAPTDPPEV
ncbi:MAG: PIG-L family deacetylase [Anaerolineae bacterium]|nr:PIG-L family deacetylase [Anaerolineae bacterium]